MAFGVNSVLNMGVGALFASQAAIQTTGNNISNVNNESYVRRGVRLEEKTSIDYYPGQVGQGVNTKEVFRYFDRFVESAYLDKHTLQRRYESEHSLLSNVENVFNESLSKGISSSMTEFFKGWTKLSQEPESSYTRAALLETSQTLATSIRSAEDTMKKLEEQMNSMISSEVTSANQLIKQIADLNREINAHTINGRNNAIAMMDERDAKVRELSGILGFMEQLNEVNVDGVEPMVSVTPMRLKRRADVVTDGNIQAQILKNAPDAREGFFAVPKVVE